MRGPSPHRYVRLLGRKPCDVRLCPNSSINLSTRYCEACRIYDEKSGLPPDVQLWEQNNSLKELQKVTLCRPVPRHGALVEIVQDELFEALQLLIPEIPLITGRVFDAASKPVPGYRTMVAPRSHWIRSHAPQSQRNVCCPTCRHRKGDYFYLGNEFCSFLTIEEVGDRRAVYSSGNLHFRDDLIADVARDPQFKIATVPQPVWPADTTYDDPWVQAYHEFRKRGRAAEAKTKKFQKEMESD